MRTSWKQVCAKLKMNGVTGDARFRGGSDESVTSDDTTVTSSGTPRRLRLDNEWQMNYMIVNRNDGLFVSSIFESFFLACFLFSDHFRLQLQHMRVFAHRTYYCVSDCRPIAKRGEKTAKGARKPSSAPSDKPEVVKKPTSRIDTNMVKLKLLDATRKSIMEKAKKQLVSSYAQTDTFKTKLCKDQSIDAQDDLRVPCDASTETEIELVATVAKDGTRKSKKIL